MADTVPGKPAGCTGAGKPAYIVEHTVAEVVEYTGVDTRACIVEHTASELVEHTEVGMQACTVERIAAAELPPVP